jgi:hypothetical protein
MPYRLSSRDITAVAVCAALWAALNLTVTPIFWQLTHMPFMCDMLAFISLILVLWWTRKFGAASLTGLMVTALTFMLRPAAFHMLGFTAASIVFDIMTRAIGYSKCFNKPIASVISLVSFSTICAGVAGLIIGSFFMTFETASAVLLFSGLHAVGGFIGGVIGFIIVEALAARRVMPTVKM